MKITASGWPKNCVNEEQKKAFVEENKQRYGIDLDASEIKYNSGRRYIAKLCNNRCVLKIIFIFVHEIKFILNNHLFLVFGGVSVFETI